MTTDQIIDVSGHFGAVPFARASWTPAAVVERAAAAGITHSYVAALTGVFHEAGLGNADARAAASRHSELTAAAVVDPRSGSRALDQVDESIDAGVRLFRAFRGAQGAWPPSEATFQAAARRIADAGLVLMADLGNPIGELTDYMRALGDLDLTIIFANVTYATLGEALTVMRDDPRVHLESHRLCRPDTLEFIASELGADRVLFGTSGPPFNAQAALDLVLHANLPEPDRRLILAGNALRLIEGMAVADRSTPDLSPDPFGAPVRGPESVPIIDIHAHNGAWPYAGATSRDNHGITTLERLMAKYNVEQTLASSALAITNDFRRGNRELVEGSRGRGTIRPLVTISPHDVAGSCEEMDRWYPEPHVVGAKLHTQLSRVAIGDPRMAALFREVAARGKPVVNHVMALGGFDPPSETQQVDGIVELAARYPDLTVVAYHGGGLDWERMLDLAEPLPNLYVEYASSWPQDNPVRAAVDRLGPRRVMFGTDMDLLSPSLMVGLVDSAGLDPAAYAAVLHGNARRVFKLGPARPGDKAHS